MDAITFIPRDMREKMTIRMILNPDIWPLEFLPVKNPQMKDPTFPGFPAFGIMTRDSEGKTKLKVYMCDMFQFRNLVAQKREPPAITYDSIDAVLNAGWVVD